MLLIDLFLAFAKVGLFTFGGGYAMISIIGDNCVEKKKWITHDEMMNITVIAESTPGPIAINAATFVGCRQAGLAGALAATLGIVTPSFVVIWLISEFFENFLEITAVASAFHGIRLAVGILILNAGFNMVKKMKKKVLPRAIMLAAFAAMLCINALSLGISSILLMLAAAVVSITLCAVSGQEEKKGGTEK